MEKFLTALQKVLMPIANVMNKNRYICALRDGFVFSLPYTIVGSILISLVNMPFISDVVPENILGAITNFITPATVFSNNIIAILVVIGIASSLSQYYKIDKTHGVAMALVTFFINVPFVAATESGEVLSNVIPMSYLGVTGMFAAIILSILAVELYRFAI